METRPEENQPKCGGIAFPWVLVLMAASFVGGAFVGLHPSWLPFIPVISSAPDSSSQGAPSIIHPFQTAQPTSTPSTESTTQTP